MIMIQGEHAQVLRTNLLLTGLPAFMVLRIYFSEGRIIRTLALVAFLADVAALIPLAKIVYGELGNAAKPQPNGSALSDSSFGGCGKNPPREMYKLWIPNIVLQLVLFMTLLLAALRTWFSGKSSLIMSRILRKYERYAIFLRTKLIGL